MKKQQPKKQTQEESITTEKEYDKSEKKPRKASKELMDAIFSENKEEKIKGKEEDLFVDETQINDETLQKLTKDLSQNVITPETKTESKFVAFFKNLFKHKKKEESAQKSTEQQTLQSSSKEESRSEETPEELKEAFKGYSTEDEFDIRKWQK